MEKSSGKAVVKIDQEAFQKSMKKSLVKYSDMPTEMGNEIVEVCTTALDKFLVNRDYEGASAAIKNALDKKFGPSWQCAIGEGFGFDISCQQKFLLHLYYGKVGILCYKI